MGAKGQLPIIFIDVDEVILEFVRPFIRFLGERGLGFIQDRFLVPHNIVNPNDGRSVSQERATELLEEFRGEQQYWQVCVVGAVEAMSDLSEISEIVILTAIPPEHEEQRRRFLNSLGITYQIIIATREKGAIISEYIGNQDRSVFLIDDALANHLSLHSHLPKAVGIHLVAFEPFGLLMQPLRPGVLSARDWTHAVALVRERIADGVAAHRSTGG